MYELSINCIFTGLENSMNYASYIALYDKRLSKKRLKYIFSGIGLIWLATSILFLLDHFTTSYQEPTKLLLAICGIVISIAYFWLSLKSFSFINIPYFHIDLGHVEFKPSAFRSKKIIKWHELKAIQRAGDNIRLQMIDDSAYTLDTSKFSNQDAIQMLEGKLYNACTEKNIPFQRQA